MLNYFSLLPQSIQHKILLLNVMEELKEVYHSGFPDLKGYEKLDISLDDIIHPIDFNEGKEREGKCNAGRFTLNPECYHYLYTRNNYGKERMVNFIQRCGIVGNKTHRILDEEGPPSSSSLFGLQDSYFFCGLPLIFWSFGGRMGLRFTMDPISHLCNFQWISSEKLKKFKLIESKEEKDSWGGNIFECK